MTDRVTVRVSDPESAAARRADAGLAAVARALSRWLLDRDERHPCDVHVDLAWLHQTVAMKSPAYDTLRSAVPRGGARQ